MPWLHWRTRCKKIHYFNCFNGCHVFNSADPVHLRSVMYFISSWFLKHVPFKRSMDENIIKIYPKCAVPQSVPHCIAFGSHRTHWRSLKCSADSTRWTWLETTNLQVLSSAHLQKIGDILRRCSWWATWWVTVNVRHWGRWGSEQEKMTI